MRRGPIPAVVSTGRPAFSVARGMARAWCLLAAALAAGCEVEAPPAPAPIGPKLLPVTGRITVDGKPLPGAEVVFSPSFSDSGTHSIGETKADGTFALSFLYQPGTAAGDYRVMVSYLLGPNGKPVSLGERSGDIISKEMSRAREIIPPRYSDYRKTELRATVSRKSLRFEIDLKGPIPGLPDPLPLPEPPKPDGPGRRAEDVQAAPPEGPKQ
jgi:hypothetical protein